MKDLLYLVHRIPYPPNKGDKIRSFHLLKALASKYRVHLGTFVDSPEDLRHVEAVSRYCASCQVATINPLLRKLAALRGLWSGTALSEAFYTHDGLARWCRDVVREHRIERIVVFSSSMAQFVPAGAGASSRSVMDFCDIDSDKWRQYASHRRGLSAWVYGREASLLERRERQIAQDFDDSVFVSEREAAAFRAIAPEAANRVRSVPNGVDVDYFDPRQVHERPAQCDAPYVVFTGAMDYWANVEGVSWFVNAVWPLVRARVPQARFLIVGSKPTDEVIKLGNQPGVVVTGAVPDVRPYLQHANVAAAPLRVARGIQNKVLEAMAMERVVVATESAVQGLDVRPPEDVLVSDQPDEFARSVATALEAASAPRSAANRSYVTTRFHWTRNLDTFVSLLEGGYVAAQPARATGS
jgi:sugar transferase (PEP-CTERM/EpsH1 system associated)